MDNIAKWLSHVREIKCVREVREMRIDVRENRNFNNILIAIPNINTIYFQFCFYFSFFKNWTYLFKFPAQCYFESVGLVGLIHSLTYRPWSDRSGRSQAKSRLGE